MKKTLLVVGLCVISLICTAPVIASASLYGDFNHNNIVDINDLAHLSALWLVPDCNLTTLGIDLDSDCAVNFYEFAVFANNWMLRIPSAPTGLSATAGNANVLLDWNNNTDSNLVGYNVYRSITSGSGYTKINISLLTSSDYNDTNAVNETTYYYVVTAVNASSNESADSNEVSATPHAPAPSQATSPSPANAATNISITSTLSWTAGSGATSHDVYFGTSSTPPSIGNQTGTTYAPGTLANNTTYYWRIDEKNAGGTTTGTVWSFTTIVAAPGQATSPSPATGATGVSITPTLSWTAGSGATSHNVYFGTAASPPSIGNQTGTTYAPGTLANNTTYYWRIDEVGLGGTTTGTVWSFMTQSGSTPPAAPTGLSATAGSAKVLLDWNNNSEGDLAGYNIYRSITSGSGYSKINTSLRTSSDYNDTGVTNGTTYYYVVTAVNTALSESGYSIQVSATPGAPTTASPQNVMVPPMGYDNNTIVLIWSKPTDYSQVVDYRVYKNGVVLGPSGRFDTSRAKLYYIVTGLTPSTTYNFTVKSLNSSSTEIGASNICSVTTTPTPTILNIANAPYNASNNGTTKNTTAIQNAINDCPAGGVVLVPAGGTGYLTGAIFLKSNMTLRVDGTLIGAEGSENTDYPKTSWRVPYYSGGVNFMGLVNAYNNYTDANTYPDPHGAGRPYILHDIRICGSGTIEGDIHSTLVNSHIHVGYNESLILDDSHIGDMITIKGVTNFYIGGWGSGTLTLIRPPEHTMFVSYCNGVTLNALNIATYDLHNADGIDLTCSNIAYIFNSAFDTGDDCINMNAGQGHEGQDPNVGGGVPTQNVRIFDCTTNHGHGGYVIGSFTAAWVQDSLVEDCFFINNDTSNGYPIRMKTGSNNGGGGRRITCRDIRIAGCSKQAIFLDSTYDASGYTNAGPGQFSGNTFKNITVTSSGKEIIFINGLSSTPYTNNTFDHITGNKQANLTYCTNSTFNYCTVVGTPAWVFNTGCSGLSGTNNTPQPTWP